MNPFATHMPTLIACLQHTTGPVLELGSGWFCPLLCSLSSGVFIGRLKELPCRCC